MSNKKKHRNRLRRQQRQYFEMDNFKVNFPKDVFINGKNQNVLLDETWESAEHNWQKALEKVDKRIKSVCINSQFGKFGRLIRPIKENPIVIDPAEDLKKLKPQELDKYLYGEWINDNTGQNS